MSIFEIKYEARCRHCAWIEEVYQGKLKRHKCGNCKSTMFAKQIRLADLACMNFSFERNNQ